MIPIIPHFALECIDNNDFKINLTWPKYSEEILIEENINFVVQINGKKRALIQAERNISQESLLSKIKKNDNLDKYLVNKSFSKIIFVKNKLINIIL